MQNYKEIWKDVPSYEGIYQVSNLGRIKSLNRKVWNGRVYYNSGNKILVLCNDKDGYKGVTFCVNKVRKKIKVHRLVMAVFVGESDLEVNHKNGIKSDNRLSNLEYCSRTENQFHACSTGLSKVGWTSRESHPNCKYSKEIILNIVEMRKTMTPMEISNRTGISSKYISSICTGRKWSSITGIK